MTNTKSATGDPTTVFDSDQASFIERSTYRAVWTNRTTNCRFCNACVELQSKHYYVKVRRNTDPNDQIEFTDSEYVFCDRDCAKNWFE